MESVEETKCDHSVASLGLAKTGNISALRRRGGNDGSLSNRKSIAKVQLACVGAKTFRYR